MDLRIKAALITVGIVALTAGLIFFCIFATEAVVTWTFMAAAVVTIGVVIYKAVLEVLQASAKTRARTADLEREKQVDA